MAAGLALAALVAYPFVVRHRGRARFAAVRAALVAPGAGGVDDLRREAPAADSAIQARWRAVVQRAGNSALSRGRVRIVDWMGPKVPIDGTVRGIYDADAELRAETKALLQEGLPVPGTMGAWVLAGAGPVRSPGSLPCENLLGVRNLAHLLRLEAALEEDPGPALAALDRIHASFAHPGTLIDGMIGVAFADIRDETYARLAAAGRLPEDAAARWLGEEPVEPARAVRSLRGERALFLLPFAEAIDEGTLSGNVWSVPAGPPTGPLDWLRSGGDSWQWWIHGGEASARVLEFLAAGERALREGRPVSGYVNPGDRAGDLAEVMCASLPAVARTALGARQRHRMARVLVRVLKGGPADAPPSAGPMDLAIKVVRDGTGGRVRVAIDRDAPLPGAWKELGLPPESESSRQASPFEWGQTRMEADPPPDVAGK